MKKLAIVAVAAVIAAVLITTVSFRAPGNVNAAIHEQIGAACRSGGEEVVAPGQVRDGMSLVRALQATGIIESIDVSPDAVTIRFDLSKPNSKYMSAGFDLVLEDEIAPDVDLVLIPLPVPDPDFAAHANCKNLNP